tara:strand:+ start:707 stop:1051 length:345 start_codon:yes stop_codon:yes gene_type:complete
MSQEPQLTPNTNLNILTFRLNEVEKNLERGIKDLSEKVDKILEKVNRSEVAQNELKVKVVMLEQEVQALKDKNDKQSDSINQIKVTLAERLGWGALGGGLVTFIMKMLESSGGS